MTPEDHKRWAEAVSKGEKRFKMASPCRNGHYGWRYTFGNATCVQCQQLSYQRRKHGRLHVHLIKLLDSAHKALVDEYVARLNAYTEESRNERS